MNSDMLLPLALKVNVLNCHIFVSESANQFVMNLVLVGNTEFLHHIILQQKFIL